VAPARRPGDDGVTRTVNRRSVTLTAAIAAAVAAWLAIAWWGSDERQIRRQLRRIQELVAKDPGESDLAGIGKARALSELFAEGFEVRATPVGFSTRDRRDLIGGIHRYRTLASSIRMEVAREELVIDEASRRATMHFVAIFASDRRGGLGRESYLFQLNWVEVEGEWKVDYADLLEVVEGSMPFGAAAAPSPVPIASSIGPARSRAPSRPSRSRS
jgi:hypothetical protein